VRVSLQVFTEVGNVFCPTKCNPKFGVVDGVGVNVGVVVGLAVFVGERVGVVVGLLVTVGVFVGVLVRVGVTLLVGVGVIKITSPSMHPLLSSILMTIFV
jgi:hypothetical protein